MKSLEDDMGCKLLRKQGKKAVLTEAGERLLGSARPWLRQMEELREELDGFERYGVGRLRLGASPKGCQFLLPPILHQFKEEHPRCRFEVQSGDTPRCLDMLRAGEIDMAITLEPGKGVTCEFLPWFTDELKVVVPAGHAWASKSIMDKSETHNENFILYNRDSYTFRMIVEFFRAENTRLSSFMELGSVEATKELIKAGVGVGILADWMVEKEVEAGELATLRLSRRKLTRTWGLATPKGRSLNQTEECFARIGEKVGCKWMVNRTI